MTGHTVSLVLTLLIYVLAVSAHPAGSSADDLVHAESMLDSALADAYGSHFRSDEAQLDELLRNLPTIPLRKVKDNSVPLQSRKKPPAKPGRGSKDVPIDESLPPLINDPTKIDRPTATMPPVKTMAPVDIGCSKASSDKRVYTCATLPKCCAGHEGKGKNEATVQCLASTVRAAYSCNIQPTAKCRPKLCKPICKTISGAAGKSSSPRNKRVCTKDSACQRWNKQCLTVRMRAMTQSANMPKVLKPTMTKLPARTPPSVKTHQQDSVNAVGSEDSSTLLPFPESSAPNTRKSANHNKQSINAVGSQDSSALLPFPRKPISQDSSALLPFPRKPIQTFTMPPIPKDNFTMPPIPKETFTMPPIPKESAMKAPNTAKVPVPTMPKVPITALNEGHSLESTFDGYTTSACATVGKDLLQFLAKQMSARSFKCLATWSQVTETQVLFFIGSFSATDTAQLQVCRLRNMSSSINEVRFVEPKLVENRSVPASSLVEPLQVQNEYMLDFCRPLFGLADSVHLEPNVMRINTNESNGWTAQLYPKFAMQSIEMTRKTSLGYKPSEYLLGLPQPVPLTPQELLQIPLTFDHRVEMKANGIECKTWHVGEQKTCGSCWAFASARVYNDRLCKASKGRFDIELSEQDMVSCYSSGQFRYAGSSDKQLITDKFGEWTPADGCEGGSPVNALLAMVSSGRVSRWAEPYVAKSYSSHRCGAHKYSNSLKYTLDRNKLWRITTGDRNLIKAQIHSGGPVVAAIKVYQDLIAYSTGVYKKTTNSFVGNHLIALVGWGSNHWVVANSWGESWGEKGYARIKFGEVDIESEIVYPEVKTPTSCSSARACKNGGEFTSDCNCHCDGLWSGASCEVCARTCDNGGMMRKDTCTCSCVPGYFGETCSEYWLAQWESTNGFQATIRFSWNVKTIEPGSKFVRYANAFGAANNPTVDNYDVDIQGTSGETTKTIDLNARLPAPYPRDQWVYAVHVSLGRNEFGRSRGYKVVDLPPLQHDRDDGCFKGGFKPGSWSTVHKCGGAWSDGLQPAGTSAPVEHFTAYPTMQQTSSSAAECITGNGNTYKGTAHVTASGKSCGRWDTIGTNYQSLITEANYCRWTKGSSAPWCYYMQGSVRKWEVCNIPKCGQSALKESDCMKKGNGKAYRGKVAVTAAGEKCMSWDVVGTNYKSMAGQGAYCRQTHDTNAPWCYYTASRKWGYCNVPIC
jgi:hypothetical protein